MAQLQRAPLADQVAEALLARVRAGEWQLGAKLPGETTLGPQLGVGRSTVREAIRQLVGRGVLSSRQGAGVFVVALDAPEEWDAVLRRSDILAVIEARTAIEVEAAVLATRRRTPADMRAIRRALRERAEHRSIIEDHVGADIAFHRSIVAAAHNPILLELFDGFTPRLRQAMIEMLRMRARFAGGAGFACGSDEDHRVHETLADAVAARDADGASVLTRAHLEALAAALG